MAGRIELITGPMGAGKTSELLKRWGRHYGKGKKVTPCFVPALLGKPGERSIVVKMHDGKVFVAERCEDLQAKFEELHKEWENTDYEVVITIDEVQFFPPDIVPAIKRAAREWGWTVICAGLNMDFRAYGWEITDNIWEIADAYIELYAKCAVCGGRAEYTQRRHLDGTPARWDEPRIVLNDGSVRYEPRCWQCHVVASEGAE